MSYKEPETYWEKRCQSNEDLLDAVIDILKEALPPKFSDDLIEEYNINYKRTQDL